MKEDLKCEKCKGDMVQGFIPDSMDGVTSFVSSWVEGKPQKSFWSHTKAPFERRIPIGVFRCKGCGFLEFYSDEEFAAK